MHYNSILSSNIKHKLNHFYYVNIIFKEYVIYDIL